MLRLVIELPMSRIFAVYNIIHRAKATINLIVYLMMFKFILMRSDKKCKLQGQKEKRQRFLFYKKNVREIKKLVFIGVIKNVFNIYIWFHILLHNYLSSIFWPTSNNLLILQH